MKWRLQQSTCGDRALGLFHEKRTCGRQFNMHNRFANIANYLTMARIMMIPPFFVAAAYHLREVNNGGQPGEWDMMPGEPTFRLGLQILFICIVTTDFFGWVYRPPDKDGLVAGKSAGSSRG